MWRRQLYKMDGIKQLIKAEFHRKGNNKMAKRKYIYFCEVERFGYTLQCIALTEKECKRAMIDEYVRAYKQQNGTDPEEAYEWMRKNKNRDDIEELDEYYEYEDDAEYFKTFLEELNAEKRELNIVEWT